MAKPTTKRPQGKRIELFLPDDHPFFEEVPKGQWNRWIRKAIEEKLSTTQSLSEIIGRLDLLETRMETIKRNRDNMNPKTISIQKNSDIDLSALYNF